LRASPASLAAYRVHHAEQNFALCFYVKSFAQQKARDSGAVGSGNFVPVLQANLFPIPQARD
jgi:hypothetical protein